MTIKEVICSNCNKKFSIELRRYNEYVKNNWNFYCCKQCKSQARTKAIQLICANCGRIIIKTPSSIIKNKKNFCSSSCAATFNNKLRNRTNWSMSLESREKIKNRLKEYWDKNPFIPSTKICSVCGKEFVPQKLNSGHFSKRTTCSDECLKKLKSFNGLKVYQKCIKDGTFRGWQSRNITSYPERFWIKVLQNNNISFEREKHVGKYFLDFVISINSKLIDLEIDGKQHKYQNRRLSDQIRDKFLSENGYIVYRIIWNEINSNEGKNIMKDKINEFINFLNILSNK